MNRRRVTLTVQVDLDPVPGTFHEPESARSTVERILNEMIPHYNPVADLDIQVTDLTSDEGLVELRRRLSK